MIELLAPVGNFDCLKAAIQNGADAVYFGANLFSARAFASNFDLKNLEKAINYAKIRGVKTNLTLNTLIKNNEFGQAIELATKAYEFGIDAIIIQDIGLATYLNSKLPDITLHASTQMTVHNLDGVLELAKRGFKRVVLSRELSIDEIAYICKNSPIEIEVFIHGALCISYSGDCLFSSMIGGRSGNRGKCAQPCRLPYTLIENDSKMDSGYLLSTRDLCSLDFIPQLINAGVTSFKIEGRMKSPEYVATVTKTYRKYINLAIKNSSILVSDEDKTDLLQIFNRGGFSSGHLSNLPNNKLIYSEKPNNMGIFLGKVNSFSPSSGHISLKLNTTLEVGDKICIQTKKEESNYTVSELMKKKQNTKIAYPNDIVTIGRMKGTIHENDKIYKMSSAKLISSAKNSYSKEYKKRALYCQISLKKSEPCKIKIWDDNGISVEQISDIIPVIALNSPITEDRIIAQLSKTSDTPYIFKNIYVDLEENLYISPISALNELRRNIIHSYEELLINSFKKYSKYKNIKDDITKTQNQFTFQKCKPKISILINNLDNNSDYIKLQNIDNIYIPLKYFIKKECQNTIYSLMQKFKIYIYMPHIMRTNYYKLFNNNISNILNNFTISGFVISNIGQLHLLQSYQKNYEIIANYNLNTFNTFSALALNCTKVTISPELGLADIPIVKNSELIVYGTLPIMTSNYCLLGKSNHCYTTCTKKCMEKNKYYIIDRKGFKFQIIPDNIETVTTIYNSKITSFDYKSYPVNNLRIDFLNETITEMQDVISKIISGKKIEGKNYTNGIILE